jgi:hypothetical protein
VEKREIHSRPEMNMTRNAILRGNIAVRANSGGEHPMAALTPKLTLGLRRASGHWPRQLEGGGAPHTGSKASNVGTTLFPPYLADHLT